MVHNDSFGSMLRRHRLGANLTQVALAARSGLSVAAISMLERNKRLAPRRSTVDALARALRLADGMREVLIEVAEAPTALHAGRYRSPTHTTYPARIAEDWREAHAALAAGLPRAAAAMACRAIYGACVDAKATAAKCLSDLIEELGKASIAHPILVEWALQIRLFRCTPAHFPDDGIDGVTVEEAATVVAFLDELLRLVYELPDRLAKLKAGTAP